MGYPLTHSTSVSQNANVPANWTRTYSRSSSISADSYYNPAVPPNNDEEEDEESWSESLEPAPPYDPPRSRSKIGKVTITDVTSVASADLVSGGDQTPRNPKSITMEQLVEAAQKIQARENLDLEPDSEPADPYLIREKPPPAVAMANPPQRVQNVGATRYPAHKRSINEYEDADPRGGPYGRPVSPQPYMTPSESRHHVPMPQPKRPASRAGTNSNANEYGPRITRLSRQAPQPPLPQEISRSPSLTSTVSSMVSSPEAISASPSSGKCPHCKINRWLPHSPSCPNKK